MRIFKYEIFKIQNVMVFILLIKVENMFGIYLNDNF